MAKKTTGKIIGIADLEAEFGLEGLVIRTALRKAGYKAPALEVEAGTFGPRAKYQWDEGSAELAKVRGILRDVKPPVKRTAAK